jgi:hypothetical protein
MKATYVLRGIIGLALVLALGLAGCDTGGSGGGGQPPTR